jgi:hypothetical protein
MPVSFEQIVAVLRQMSSADYQRLLDLVPELRQAAQPVTYSAQKARPGQKHTSSAPKSSAVYGQYDEDAGPSMSPMSPGMVQGGLEIGTDLMGDLSRSTWREP